MTDTPIADLIERMLGAGVPHATVVDSVRTIEVMGLVTRATSRDVAQNVARDGLSMTPGAIRSRRWRQNTNKNGKTAEANDAAQQPVPERHAQRHGVTQRCDLSSSLSSENGIREVKKEVVARARGTAITRDWQPSPDVRAFVAGLGVDADALLAEFIDYWIAVPGARGRKLDWDSTFRNRAREVAGRRAGRVNGHAPRPGSKEDTRERTVLALRALNAFAEANDEGPSREADPSVSGFLPFAKPA